MANAGALRIVFVGCVEFSRHCLLEVLQCGGDVAAVMTLSPEGAGRHADYVDLGEVAVSHAIPVHRVANINDPNAIEQVRAYRPELLFVWGWSQIVQKPLLDVPTMGCIGVHPALLPVNRGRHPLIWAIALGLRETGLTFFWMDEAVDSGPILAQRQIEIGPREDAGSLYEKMKGAASDMIPEFLARLITGTAERRGQDHSRANVWRKRYQGDGRIDFRMSAAAIDRLVRALTRPYPGAHLELDGRAMKVWQTRTLPLPKEFRNLEYGRVLWVDGRSIAVRADEGIVLLVEHEFDPLPSPGEYL